MQAQCQRDLKGLSKQIESKQSDLEKAEQALQQQQKTEAAVHKQILEAERRLQVDAATVLASVIRPATCLLTSNAPVTWQPWYTVHAKAL